MAQSILAIYLRERQHTIMGACRARVAKLPLWIGGRNQAQDDFTPDLIFNLAIAALMSLSGHVDLGMKREALRTARRKLNDSIMTAKALNDALNAILTNADGLKSWTQTVESSYSFCPSVSDHRPGFSSCHFAPAGMTMKAFCE